MLGTRAFVPMTSGRAEATLQPAIRLGGLQPPVTAALRPMPVIAIPEARPALRLEFVLLTIPLAVLAVLALLPGLLGPSLDAAVFSVVGQRLANGELPYAQVFDHKPPGLYLLIGLGDLLGGPLGAWRVSWLISVAAAALTGVLVADTLRLLGWRRLAWLCGGLCTALLASFPLALGGGLGETVAVLPAAAAVRLGAAGSVGSRRSFAIGALAAGAAAISLQAVPALFAVLVIAALNSDRGRRAAAERTLGMAWIGVGAASVMSALVILLGSAGATGAAVQAVIGYNRAFAGLAGLDDPMAGQAMHAVLVLAPLLVPAVIGLPATLSHADRRPVAIGALTWIALSTALVVVQGRLELHYLSLIVPPLALLAPAGFVLHLRGGHGVVARGAIVAGLLAVAFSISTLVSTSETAMALDARAAEAERSQAVAGWVSANTPPDARIFVWGNEPSVYLDADRAPASAFVYLLPLTTPGFVTDKVVASVLQEWSASPPAAIIDAGSSAPGVAGLPPLLVDRPVLELDGRDMDILEPLRAFVRDRYVQATTVDGWPVYVLR